MRHISEVLAELADHPTLADAIRGVHKPAETPPEPPEAPESDDEGLPLGWEGVEVVE